jgi:hypothetical protein
MRHLLSPLAAALLLSLALPSLAHAAGFMKELENALKRGDKERASTTLVLHPGGGEEVTITPDDFDSYEIHYSEDKLPLAIEMYSGSGAKKNDIWINLMQCSYWRMDIEKKDGRWHYVFHFHF